METLVQTLEAMIDFHTGLLELANQKRDILMKGHIDGLQSVVIHENTCVMEINKLEQQRLHYVQDYMAQKGIVGHSFTLEEFINVADDEALNASLSHLAKQLRQIIKELSQINESNQQLIKTSLSYIQYSLSILVRKEPAIGYGPKSGSRYASLLDAKV